MQRRSGLGHKLTVRQETLDRIRNGLLPFPVERTFVVVFQRVERVPETVHVGHVQGVFGGIFRVERAEAAGFLVLFLAEDGVEAHVGFVVFQGEVGKIADLAFESEAGAEGAW